NTLRTWRDKHGDAWMPFWQINRKHPWSERDHEDIRTTLLNQRLVEFLEVRTGGRPSKQYRLLPTSLPPGPRHKYFLRAQKVGAGAQKVKKCAKSLGS